MEKFPLRYEIDTLRCIYCGMCVEACPCDAIRMDTYVHPKIWGYKRADFIETKERLDESLDGPRRTRPRRADGGSARRDYKDELR